MNAKLLLKVIFLMVVLLLLVIMGMHNRGPVQFQLPPLFRSVAQPAAIMYFAFFAVGVITGTVLTAGIGKKGAGSGKPAKSTR
jgi:uncharacterized integral membrane protein